MANERNFVCNCRARRVTDGPDYGRPDPTFDLMIDASVALILPLVFTSNRKFVEPTVCPICDLACATSLALTARYLLGAVSSLSGWPSPFQYNSPKSYNKLRIHVRTVSAPVAANQPAKGNAVVTGRCDDVDPAHRVTVLCPLR
jgi:hypothetical protein